MLSTIKTDYAPTNIIGEEFQIRIKDGAMQLLDLKIRNFKGLVHFYL